MKTLKQFLLEVAESKPANKTLGEWRYEKLKEANPVLFEEIIFFNAENFHIMPEQLLKYLNENWASCLEIPKEPILTDFEKLVERSYQTVIRRGKIDKNTTDFDFLEKVKEEVKEAEIEYLCYDEKNMEVEICDVILSCFSWLRHRKANIWKLLNEKTDFNEKRED